MKTMIALDLELEQPKSDRIPDSFTDVPKIIQVGWVVFNTTPFIVLGTYSMFTDYCFYHGPVSRYIQELTGITKEHMDAGVPLIEIYTELVECRERNNTSRIVCQWGRSDMQCLRDELPDGIEWEFGQSGLNVKHMYMAYAHRMGIKARCGLSKALGRLGIPWRGRRRHRADIDALNTASMYSYLVNQWPLNKEL